MPQKTLYEDAVCGQTFFHFLYNTLIIVIELSLICLIARRWKRDFAIADFCGRGLTTICVVQWMIIGWMTSFQDDLHLEPAWRCPWHLASWSPLPPSASPSFSRRASRRLPSITQSERR